MGSGPFAETEKMEGKWFAVVKRQKQSHFHFMLLKVFKRSLIYIQVESSEHTSETSEKSGKRKQSLSIKAQSKY